MVAHHLDKQTLKRQVDLRELAQTILGPPARQKPNYWVWSAPDRSDTNPSLTVFPTNFKDFGGDQQGDAIAFVQYYLHKDFREALAYLETYVGQPATLPLPPRPAALVSPALRHSQRWQAQLTHLVEHRRPHAFSGQRGQQAFTYLVQDRGLSAATIHAAQLFYAGDQWLDTGYIKADGKSSKIPPHALCIPYFRDGHLVRLRYRLPTLDAHGQPDGYAQRLDLTTAQVRYTNRDNHKYMQVADGDSQAYYGQIQPNQPVVITEGEFDALIVQQAVGSRASVITLGSASSRLPTAVLTALEQTGVVIIATDRDQAGQQVAATYHTQLTATYPHLAVAVVPPPAGYKDHNEAYLVGHHNPVLRPVVDHQRWLTRGLDSLSVNSRPTGIWAHGTPDNLRRVFLQIRQLTGGRVKDHAKAGAIYDVIQSLGRSHFRRVDLQHHTPMSEASVRRACQQLLALGLIVEEEFSSTFYPIDDLPQKEGLKSDENSVGRPSVGYRLLPIEQQLTNLRTHLLDLAHVAAWAKYGLLAPDTVEAHILEETPEHAAARAEYHAQRQALDRLLSGLDEHASSLSMPTDIKSGGEYREVFYLHTTAADIVTSATDADGITTHYGRTITSAARARELGVSKPTLLRIRAKYGIRTRTNWRRYELRQADDLLAQIALFAPARPHLAGLRIQAGYRLFNLYNADRHPQNLQKIEQAIAESLAHGQAVFLEVQQASTELPLSPDAIEPARHRLAAESPPSAKPLVASASPDEDRPAVALKTPQPRQPQARVISPETVRQARWQLIREVLRHKRDHGLLDNRQPTVLRLLARYGLAGPLATPNESIAVNLGE